MSIDTCDDAAPALSAFHLPVASFDALIRAHGVPATVRMARPCACWLPETGEADPACLLCYPYGWIWGAPVATTVWMPNRRPRRSYDEHGTQESGDHRMSFLSGMRPTHYSRVQLTAIEIPVADTLTKGREDMIRYSSVLAVEGAYYTVRTPPTGPDYANSEVTLRIEGQDASPDIRIVDRRVEWITAPIPTGARYVLQIRTHPEFIVWETQERAEGTRALQAAATVKRVDYLQHPRGTAEASY